MSLYELFKVESFIFLSLRTSNSILPIQQFFANIQSMVFSIGNFLV